MAGAGTSNTSAIVFGGSVPPSAITETESWNGTSWTEVNDLNTAKKDGGSAGASNTNALAFGGNPAPATATTESWNGTSWTEVNDLNTARKSLGGAGTQTSALAFAGGPSVPTNGNLTEEWSESPVAAVVTITTS